MVLLLNLRALAGHWMLFVNDTYKESKRPTIMTQQALTWVSTAAKRRTTANMFAVVSFW